MTDRLAEIRALLAAATSGPWERVGKYPVVQVGDFRLAEADSGSDADLIAAAPELLAWCVAEIERLRGVQGSLRDWAQGRVETLTRCIATEGVSSNTKAEMMYERTIMRDIVAMLAEATP